MIQRSNREGDILKLSTERDILEFDLNDPLQCREALIIAENQFSIITTDVLTAIHNNFPNTSNRTVKLVAFKNDSDIELEIVNDSSQRIVLNQPIVRYDLLQFASKKAFEVIGELDDKYILESGDKIRFTFKRDHATNSNIGALMNAGQPIDFIALVTNTVGDIFISRKISFSF